MVPGAYYVFADAMREFLLRITEELLVAEKVQDEKAQISITCTVIKVFH